MSRHPRYRVTIYGAADGWRWRMRAGNGRILCHSGEAYTSRAGVLRALASLSAYGERAFEEACVWPDEHTEGAER